MTLFIDTHAHLCDDQFDPDREAVLHRAKERGVNTIVEIADRPEDWEKAKVFSERLGVKKNESLPSIFWSCGFHPHYAANSLEFNFDIMKKTASATDCAAIGEIGLDYVKSSASKEEQTALFRKSLEVAAELAKPVVIHCRQAQADCLRILKSFFGGTARQDLATGVIHCFSGDLHFAEAALDLGFYLGIDGPITYPSAKDLREVISKAPLDRIVLETDSPYLPPQHFRGKRNEPTHLVLIAEKVAELFQKSVEEISKTTTENARRLFRLK